MLQKIQQSFGVPLAASALIEARTIKALSKLIQSYSKINEDDSALILLKKGSNDKSPLFMLHPIGGTVFCYLSLIDNLKLDMNVYGFQDPSIHQARALFATLEEMASYYRKMIEKIQPEGEYSLCGASFGGVLVVEIAYQLLQRGKKVNFIGLLDSWAAYSSIQKNPRYFEFLFARHNEDDYFPFLPKEGNKELWKQLLEKRLLMMLHHSIKKIDITLTLFKATEILPEYKEINQRDNHWSSYSTKPVNVVNVSGDHHTMLQELHSKELADIISKLLIK